MPKAAAPGREERLQIRSFGPIETADITVRPLTVFVGPQATGKSLTAQLLYFMRGIEELVAPEFESNKCLELAVSWFDPGIFGSALATRHNGSHKFRAEWQPLTLDERQAAPSALVQEFDANDPLILQPNAALRQRLSQAQAASTNDFSSEYQVYVPAGRLLCSLVNPSLALNLTKRGRLAWPGFLNMFYEKLESAIRELPLLNVSGPIEQPKPTLLTEKSRSSLRGTLVRDRKNNVELISNLRGISYQTSTGISSGLASGQLETWPLWTILLAHLQSPQIKRIFIEEPEAHVHPTAQRDIMEALVTLLHHNFRFVITTHSPYVIYALNNALLAGQVQKAGRKLPKGISEEFALAKEDIAAYRFTPDGQVRSLFDPETGLLDTGELDDPAAALSAQFTDLQDALHPDEE